MDSTQLEPTQFIIHAVPPLQSIHPSTHPIHSNLAQTRLFFDDFQIWFAIIEF